MYDRAIFKRFMPHGLKKKFHKDAMWSCARFPFHFGARLKPLLSIPRPFPAITRTKAWIQIYSTMVSVSDLIILLHLYAGDTIGLVYVINCQITEQRLQIGFCGLSE